MDVEFSWSLHENLSRGKRRKGKNKWPRQTVVNLGIHTTSSSLGCQDLLNAASEGGIWLLDFPFAPLEWRGGAVHMLARVAHAITNFFTMPLTILEKYSKKKCKMIKKKKNSLVNKITFMDRDLFFEVELFIISLGIYHDYGSLLQWRALNKLKEKKNLT